MCPYPPQILCGLALDRRSWQVGLCLVHPVNYDCEVVVGLISCLVAMVVVLHPLSTIVDIL